VQEREVLRHVVVNLHKRHPKASQRDLAKLANCSKGVVQKALAKLKRVSPWGTPPKVADQGCCRGKAWTGLSS